MSEKKLLWEKMSKEELASFLSSYLHAANELARELLEAKQKKWSEVGELADDLRRSYSTYSLSMEKVSERLDAILNSGSVDKEPLLKKHGIPQCVSLVGFAETADEMIECLLRNAGGDEESTVVAPSDEDASGGGERSFPHGLSREFAEDLAAIDEVLSEGGSAIDEILAAYISPDEADDDELPTDEEPETKE